MNFPHCAKTNIKLSLSPFYISLVIVVHFLLLFVSFYCLVWNVYYSHVCGIFIQCPNLITDDTDNDFITKIVNCLFLLISVYMEFYFLYYVCCNFTFDYNIYNFDISSSSSKKEQQKQTFVQLNCECKQKLRWLLKSKKAIKNIIT